MQQLKPQTHETTRQDILAELSYPCCTASSKKGKIKIAPSGLVLVSCKRLRQIASRHELVHQHELRCAQAVKVSVWHFTPAQAW